MNTVTEQSLVVSVDDLAIADLDGEAVVLEPRSGRYFGLNGVGMRILELAQQPRSVSEIVQVLHDEYEVDAEQLERDVMDFLREMKSSKLIQTDASSI